MSLLCRQAVRGTSKDCCDLGILCAGWAPGVIALLLGFGVTFWTSRIIASFHEYGGKRHIRYRDLASTVLGMTSEPCLHLLARHIVPLVCHSREQ